MTQWTLKDPETARSSGSVYVPSRPLIVLSFSGEPRCDFGPQLNKRDFCSMLGNVFVGPSAPDEPTAKTKEEKEKEVYRAMRPQRRVGNGKRYFQAQRKGQSYILLAFECLVSTSAIIIETSRKRILL